MHHCAFGRCLRRREVYNDCVAAHITTLGVPLVDGRRFLRALSAFLVFEALWTLVAFSVSMGACVGPVAVWEFLCVSCVT